MDVNNNTTQYGVDTTVLPIVGLHHCDGGTLIVKEWGDRLPIVGCSQENCYDLAEFMCFLISMDFEHHISFLCKEHKDNLVENTKTEPAFIYH